MIRDKVCTLQFLKGIQIYLDRYLNRQPSHLGGNNISGGGQSDQTIFLMTLPSNITI